MEANASLDSAGSRALAEHRLGEHLAGVFLEEEPRSLDGIPSGLAVVGPEGQERQTLTQTNAGRHRWIAGNGRQERVVRWGYRRMADLRMSITDPDALVTPVEVNESLTMLEMLFKSRFRWRLRLRSVTGDAAFGTRENLASVEKSGIRAYLALPDQGKRTSLFTKDTFAFDAKRTSTPVREARPCTASVATAGEGTSSTVPSPLPATSAPSRANARTARVGDG